MAKEILKLQLIKNLNRDILRGHPWVYKSALKVLPKAEPGSVAKLVDKSNKFIAFGFYDPKCDLCFRVCSLNEKQKPNQFWSHQNMTSALNLRKVISGDSYRLFNGEGDSLPGLICDIYHKAAVIQLDGEGPIGFWNLDKIKLWLEEHLELDHIIYKPRGDLKQSVNILKGQKEELINYSFHENKNKFSANLLEGQKTGFFLDQRDNRDFIQKISKGKRVLNLFSYTGGFSVCAGNGGASHVTSVDISKPAIKQSEINWELNGLTQSSHTACAENVFDFLNRSQENKDKWDIVIVDPPSFSHSKSGFKEAVESYEKIFTQAISVCEKGGYVALSSCSSHINEEKFIDICVNSFSKSRKVARVITIKGQAADHPFPLACLEYRYLKFILFQSV